MSQLQNPRGPLDEAEIQLLATLHAKSSVRGENRQAALEAHGSRYGEYLQDWSSAYSSLVDKGLVKRRAEAFELTPSGLPLALDYHRQRPVSTGITTSSSITGLIKATRIPDSVNGLLGKTSARKACSIWAHCRPC